VSDRMKKEACMVYFKFHVPEETFTVSQISRRVSPEACMIS